MQSVSTKSKEQKAALMCQRARQASRQLTMVSNAIRGVRDRLFYRAFGFNSTRD